MNNSDERNLDSPSSFPINPLQEKWDKLYPPTPMPEYSQVCDGYSCMWCSRCPRGDNWKVPEEDLEIWNQYQQALTEYLNNNSVMILDKIEPLEKPKIKTKISDRKLF